MRWAIGCAVVKRLRKVDELHGAGARNPLLGSSVVLFFSAGPHCVANGRKDVLNFGQETLIEGLVNPLYAFFEFLRAGGSDESSRDVAMRGGKLERELGEARLPLLTVND